MNRKMAGKLASVLVPVMAVAGCTTVGQVRNLGDASCANAFERQLASILVAQHETDADARGLAARATQALVASAPGPRPFLVEAPSGTDYSLFVEPAEPTCLLRLYGRQHGFTRYTNNLTWIETRPLPECRCTP